LKILDCPTVRLRRTATQTQHFLFTILQLLRRLDWLLALTRPCTNAFPLITSIDISSNNGEKRALFRTTRGASTCVIHPTYLPG